MKKKIYKYRYQIIITLLILFNICVVINNKDNYVIKEQTITTKNEENKIEMQVEDDYKIKIYYPITKYRILNEKINETVTQYIDSFKNKIKTPNEKLNQYYTLNIQYEYYSYEKKISYVFYINEYSGGPHQNTLISTISFDKEQNKMIDIDNLIEKNSIIIKQISNYCREKLLKNPNVDDMEKLMYATDEQKENFSQFAFTKDGLLIFFEPYEISSYSKGTFSVKIPYYKINLTN